MKLSKDVVAMDLNFKGERIDVRQNEIDPCVFQFCSRSDNSVRGLLLTHVDDLMLLAEKEFSNYVQAQIQERFPVDEWQHNDFEYVGCSYHCTPDEITITQKTYAEGRVDKVSAVSEVPGVVSKEQIEENRTSIGSLS